MDIVLQQHEPMVISPDTIAMASVATDGNLSGDYYLWAGIAQGEIFTYESDFVPIRLPALGPINIIMYPKKPIPGYGDLVAMILSAPDWIEGHRLMRIVTLDAYEVES